MIEKAYGPVCKLHHVRNKAYTEKKILWSFRHHSHAQQLDSASASVPIVSSSRFPSFAGTNRLLPCCVSWIRSNALTCSHTALQVRFCVHLKASCYMWWSQESPYRLGSFKHCNVTNVSERNTLRQRCKRCHCRTNLLRPTYTWTMNTIRWTRQVCSTLWL